MSSFEVKKVRDCGPYVYRIDSFRDPENGRPRKKRKYLGRLSDFEKWFASGLS